MKNIEISEYHSRQELEIHNLIKRVYDEFVSADYSPAGNQFFYDWIEPSKIAERQQLKRAIFVALADSEIIGMIEIRDNNTISLLFVDKSFHGQGIARKLFHKALKNCLLNDPTLDKFYVHASPFSIPVYKKLGFAETDTMQEQNGIKYLPMEKPLTIN
ncbi:MAG: GNAT family N-acetyltransferase [Bacteroidales bacterium]|jgi:GNAT superfamily N-acetyltransferase